MLRSGLLIAVISIALTLYSFIDCARREDSQLRRLPKWGWLLVILFLSTLGAIGYLVFGRVRGQKGPRTPKRRILPPDDDPDFLRSL